MLTRRSFFRAFAGLALVPAAGLAGKHALSDDMRSFYDECQRNIKHSSKLNSDFNTVYNDFRIKR